MWVSTLAISALAVLHGAAAQNATRATTTYLNSVKYMFDTDGNQIDAYGAKIQQFICNVALKLAMTAYDIDGTYYLYGIAYGVGASGGMNNLKSYSSNDLVNWKFEGLLCPASAGCGGGRPHILYNAKSKNYVLWTDGMTTFSGYQVSTSSSPTGPFTKSRTNAGIDSAHRGLKPADFTIEEVDGRGYAAYSVLNFMYAQGGSLWPPINQSMYAARLTDDYTSTDLKGYPIRTSEFDLIDNEGESPDLFYRNGLYYVAASNTCGNCNSSIGLLYRANSIEGPWTRQIISGDSCGGQVEGVFDLTDPVSKEVSYIWHSTAVPGGPRVAWAGHIFSKLEFNTDGSVKPLDCSPFKTHQVHFTPGTGPTPSGKLLVAANGSPAIANYQPVCDSDVFTVFQTWQSSKSGTLKEVSVNIARAYQTTPLSLKVFKFNSYEDLIKPNYKYTNLASKTLRSGSLELSFAFGAVTVPNINAIVKQGDYLAVSIAGSDFSPYCHLEYDTMAHSSGLGGQAPGKLFVQGAGQNSWRGLDGKTSVIYEREGKGVKFFARVD